MANTSPAPTSTPSLLLLCSGVLLALSRLSAGEGNILGSWLGSLSAFLFRSPFSTRGRRARNRSGYGIFTQSSSSTVDSTGLRYVLHSRSLWQLAHLYLQYNISYLWASVPLSWLSHVYFKKRYTALWAKVRGLINYAQHDSKDTC